MLTNFEKALESFSRLANVDLDVLSAVLGLTCCAGWPAKRQGAKVRIHARVLLEDDKGVSEATGRHR